MTLIIRKIKWAIQRALYGIDDSMTYDLDHYLIDHIAKLLRQYKVQAEENVDLEFNKDSRGKTQKQWLDEMIGAFEKYENGTDACCNYSIESGEVITKKMIAKFNRVATRRRNKLKELFGELFDTLWW